MQTLPPLDATPELAERFWRYVRRNKGRDACWEWQGTLTGANASGQQYGIIGVRVGDKRRRYKAHRVAFLIQHGRWPELHVCHTCDNPKCVRGSHLFEGTHRDNMHDKLRKNRGCTYLPRQQPKHPRVPKWLYSHTNQRVLTWEVVKALRADHAKQPLNFAEVAKAFALRERTIRDAVTGKTWKLDEK